MPGSEDESQPGKKGFDKMDCLKYDYGTLRRACENLDTIRQHGGSGQIILDEELGYARQERQEQRDATFHYPGNLAHDLAQLLKLDPDDLTPIAEDVIWGQPVLVALERAAERVRQGESDRPAVQREHHPAIARQERQATIRKPRTAQGRVA
jgi:hypothetical protein